jgi:hypothetical protein
MTIWFMQEVLLRFSNTGVWSPVRVLLTYFVKYFDFIFWLLVAGRKPKNAPEELGINRSSGSASERWLLWLPQKCLALRRNDYVWQAG